MKQEIAVVIFFLKGYLKKSHHDSKKIDLFVERLAVALQDKFKGHWYPDNPSKGQAYRCIRINKCHRQDPEIFQACQESGIQYQDLKLPDELTLWVDPGEVCCRYEEFRHFFSLATLSKDEDEKEVAKKVTKALERVTSDYHSVFLLLCCIIHLCPLN
uniref:Anti-proliferative protein domain-containing protein n=1 Tax=Periophthalmus magnuspinnatus TaxID=409849 RepID=A0A3B3ZGD9_9GOBI